MHWGLKILEFFRFFSKKMPLKLLFLDRIPGRIQNTKYSVLPDRIPDRFSDFGQDRIPDRIGEKSICLKPCFLGTYLILI